MVQTSDPSKGVTREVLKQLRTVPIVDIDSKLDCLYEVWPRLDSLHSGPQLEYPIRGRWA